MKVINLLIITTIVLGSLSCLYTDTSEASLTVSPTMIYEWKDLLRGSTYENTIWLYNLDNDNAENVTINATGILKGNVSFYPINDSENPITGIFSLSPNNITKIKMKYKVPYELANGDYSSKIYVEQVQETQEEDNTTTVHIVYPIEYFFSVTGEEDFNISVTQFTIVESEVNYPLLINVFFNNTGNVVANPYINITFFLDGFYQGQTSATDSVSPGDAYKRIQLNWDTVGKSAGDFVAKVLIKARDEILMDQNVSFKLYPAGTFTRSGQFESLEFEEDEEIGRNETVKLIALFRNTGKVGVYARFSGEIYFNGDLIDTKDSEEFYVEKHGAYPIPYYYKLRDEDGEYTIRGKVIYDVNETETLSISFTVGNNNQEKIDENQIIGEFVNLELEHIEDLRINDLLKINAEFKNTGKTSIKAQFFGEVFLNGKLIDIIESQELFVQESTTKLLITYYDIGDDYGNYSINGYILYEGNKTDYITKSFILNEEELLDNNNYVHSTENKTNLLNEVPGFELIILLIAIFIVIVFISNKN